MRIAAMAAGAVGGYFGARMAAAGHDVFFIARGAHLRGHQEGRPHHRERARRPAPAASRTSPTIRPRSARSTSCCSRSSCGTPSRPPNRRVPCSAPTRASSRLQNGVDSYERIAPIVGAERAIPGVTYVVTVIDRPGVIKQTSKFQSIICGTVDGRADAPLAAFVDAAKAAGIDDHAVRQYRARPLAQVHLPLRDLRRHRRHAHADGADPRRPRHARPVPQHHARDLGGRPRQGRRHRRELRRRTHGLRRQYGADHEGLDGERPRARQPARARLAGGHGLAPRQAIRRADAGQRHHLCRAQAAPDGNAG